jgi:cell wall-associated NlpC family hydrolase
MTTTVCTMLCALIATPVGADPGSSVPDSGARPLPAGQVVWPGGTASTTGNTGYVATPAIGPFASQVMAEDVAVQALGEQVKQLQIDLQTAQQTVTAAEATMHQAQADVADLQARADSAAAEAYKAAAGLGPLGDYASDLHNLSVLAPGVGGQPGGEEAARDLLRAQQQQKSADDAYQTANKVVQDLQLKFTNLDATFKQRNAALVDLKTKNAAEYAKAVAQSDAYEQSLGGNLPISVNIDGMQANPKAIQAVNWALSKRGSPYIWGTEGPNTFDCSGLAYWSYGKVGVRVPRVAANMYHGTQAIVATKYSRGDRLLPGDLVYFATSMSDWRTIYHMGIYIGGGYMVQAPSTGDHVKVSPVTWSRFFGATRIFPAVPKPGATPAPPPTGGGQGHPTTTPSSGPTSHTPSPTPSASHSTPPTSSAPPSAEPTPSTSTSSAAPHSEAPQSTEPSTAASANNSPSTKATSASPSPSTSGS